MGFQILQKSKHFGDKILIILSIRKPFLGSCEVPQKNGPDRFSFFEFYWIETNRQRQAKNIFKDSSIG